MLSDGKRSVKKKDEDELHRKLSSRSASFASVFSFLHYNGCFRPTLINQLNTLHLAVSVSSVYS